jgi:lipopolysaccharide export system protein LptC
MSRVITLYKICKCVESTKKLIPSQVHKDVKCKQDKPQYNEKALEDMAIVTEEQAKYRLQAKHSDKYEIAIIRM